MTHSFEYVEARCWHAVRRALGLSVTREVRKDAARYKRALEATTAKLKDERAAQMEESIQDAIERVRETPFDRAVRLGAWDGMHKPKVAG